MPSYEEIISYKSKSDVNGVLKNNLNINDKEKLDEVERVLTSYRMAELFLNNNELEFSVDYYLKIHEYLFKDIYPFAGKIRNEVIEKRIPFCLPEFIYDNLKQTLLKAEKLATKVTNEEELIDVIAYLYSELDIIHPFREGNGRTEREFLREYVEYVNKYINFGTYKMDYTFIGEEKENFINALVIADASCDTTLLKEYIRKTLVKEEQYNKQK